MSNIKKCGTISLLGRPNVGKSSIMNALIGAKVAIVSPKPQTTRNRIIGILTKDEAQFVFMDTPGLHLPKSKLGSIMVKTIYDTAESVDLALLVISPDGEPGVGKPESILIEKIKKTGIPCVLAINKIDTVKTPDILKWMEAYAAVFPFEGIIPVSARTGDGLKELTDCLSGLLPELGEGEEPLFSEDEITDQPERIIAAEFVRESLMCRLEQELPHGIATFTEEFKEADGITDITVAITCDKESHKGMIIGKHGSMLKAVGTDARLSMEKLFGCRIYLTLWVKVKDDWRNDTFVLRSLGY